MHLCKSALEIVEMELGSDTAIILELELSYLLECLRRASPILLHIPVTFRWYMSAAI